MDKFIEVNGITLHYLEHGEGKPTLLLMPGLTANANEFDGLIQAGLAEHFHVLAVDLRGRGQSGKPAQGYSMGDHARDILALMDALELDQVVLGGHSFGALLTLYITAHFPERVSKLVIIDAAAELHPQVRQLIEPSLQRMGKVLPSFDAYISAMKQMPHFHNWWDSTIESYYRADVQEFEDGSVQSRLYANGILEAVDKSLEEPWTELVQQIEQPAILLNAIEPYGLPGTPPVLPQAQAQRTVEMLGNCQYYIIPGNHMTMLFGENATQIVQILREFAAQ